MAAAVIPIASAVLGLAAPYLPDIVKLMEKAFGGGTGQTKLDTGVQIASNIVTELFSGGKIQQPAPDPNELKVLLTGAVEQTVQAMIASGEIPSTKNPNAPPPAPPAPAPVAPTLYLVRGSMQELKGVSL